MEPKMMFFLLLAGLGLCMGRQYTHEDVIRNVDHESESLLEPEHFDGIEDFREGDLKQILGPKAYARSGKRIDLNGDPIMRAGKHEGDIMLPENMTMKQFIENSAGLHNRELALREMQLPSNVVGRNAIRSKWQQWPNGEIPYVLSSKYGDYSKKVIAKAMDQYHKKTCIRFKPRTDERDYISIYPDEGCYSLVGRVGGKQPVSLDAGCIQTGTIIHELLHATGFFHEQSRADRDDWVNIVWNNIEYGAADQFEKYTLRTMQYLGANYDYGSVMHYSPFAFSKYPYNSDGETIIALKSGGEKMGQRDGFSNVDLLKANKLYNCEQSGDIGPTPAPGGDGSGIGGSGIGGSGGGGGSTTVDCTDQKWSCFAWSMLGYCSRATAKRDCPKACGLCSESDSENSATTTRSSIRRTTTRPPVISTRRPDDFNPAPINTGSDCVDLNAHCSRWAEKKDEFCNKYVRYMTKTCAKSCGFCQGSEGISDDTENEVSGPTETSDGNSCVDRHSRCESFVRRGHCSDRNAPVMRRYCKKSCNLC